MASWNEADHPRDDEGKFTYKGGGTSKSSNEDKMQNRANILYPSMTDKTIKENNNIGLGNKQNKKQSIEDIFYPFMKTKKDVEENFKQTLYNKSLEIAQISSNNTKFSDSEIQRARKFIQGEEKFRPDAYYPTQNDKLTIGYGHTGLVDGKPITPGMIITKEKAEELYRKDFERHTAQLAEIKVPLTSNQKIALASFCYNLGPNILRKENSDLRDKLNAGDIEGAMKELEKYNKQRNKTTGVQEILPGLVNRRAKEKKLFLTPDED